MLNFVSIGSGSSGNCYLLYTETTCLMIDSGIAFKTLKRHLKKLGIELEKVDALFITHDHADHIKAVGHIANTYGKPVYATEPVHVGIQHNYCVSHKPEAQHIRRISKGERVCIGELEVTPFDVPHDSSDCVGYSIRHGDTVFCLITDIGHVTQTISEQVSMADYIVLEANHDEDMLMMGKYSAYLKGRIRGDKGHLCNKESARLLAEHGTPRLKHVWLCHLSEENNHPELARKTMESVLRSYGILPGVDFELDILKRKSPSEIYHLK